MHHRILHSMLHLACSAIVLLAVAACDEKKDEKLSMPPEQLFQKGREAFDAHNYKEAVEMYDALEQEHPYSELAPKAQILAGYAQYEAQKYDDAILAFERFVKLHPSHESAAYAYYMMALCYYEQISDVGRDQGMTEKAMQSLHDVVARFPDSEFARDAQLKLDLTADHLAGKEMMVGRWYLNQGQLLAAANRFKLVIDKYQTTSHTPEALHRLVETYLKLGVRDEAVRYGAVLGHNFPSSVWYGYSYDLLKGEKPKDESLLKKVF